MSEINAQVPTQPDILDEKPIITTNMVVATSSDTVALPESEQPSTSLEVSGLSTQSLSEKVISYVKSNDLVSLQATLDSYDPICWNINGADADGYTALHHAVKLNREEALTALLGCVRKKI